MLLSIYSVLCLFVIHSALLMSSDSVIILAIGMVALLLCAFLTCLASAILVKGDLRSDNGKIILSLHKKGILPLYLIRTEFAFVYDQSGEEDTRKNTFVIHSRETAITLSVDLKYAGSGHFEIRKCSVSDLIGFFHLPLFSRKKISCSLDIMPEDREVDFYTPNNRLTGTVSDHSISVDMIGDDPSETLRIREYQPGDMISRTHWKLSAKRDVMMTRDFARESDAQYLFVLNFTVKTQESFHKIITNYNAIASSLLRQDMNHMVLWADPDGVVYDDYVNTPDDLENTLLLIYHSFERLKGNRSKDELLTPYDGWVILDEYESKAYHIAFIKRFVITDEPLEVLEGRWAVEE